MTADHVSAQPVGEPEGPFKVYPAAGFQVGEVGQPHGFGHDIDRKPTGFKGDYREAYPVGTDAVACLRTFHDKGGSDGQLR